MDHLSKQQVVVSNVPTMIAPDDSHCGIFKLQFRLQAGGDARTEHE